MKLQAILILFQAQSALAFEGSQRHSGVAACSIPCRTQLRLNETKMRQCLEDHCGIQEVTEENEKKEKNPCVARCRRLGGPDCSDRCPTDEFYATAS